MTWSESLEARAANGESGESGEKPRQQRLSQWRKSGEFRQSGGDESPEYPVDALGVLAGPVRAIASGLQIDVAMVGQSVLSAAAVSVAHRFDAEDLTGRVPLSLYLLTLAESGDGKTTADRVAFRAIEEYQREKLRRWHEEMEFYDPKSGAPQPREVTLITRDGTVEGIRRDFQHGRSSQGCFSSEAAAMVAGFGMSKDNRAKTAATFSAMWDAGELSVSRGTTGRFQLYDRRFSLHWMLQPDPAREAVQDGLLSALGFWPRFLLAWPDPAKPRKYQPFEATEDPDIGAFWERCRGHLDYTCPEECRDLPVIRLDDTARDFVGRYFENLEREAKTEAGQFVEVKPFAVRATEHLCRVAGVLAAFAEQDVVNVAMARDAAQLTTYSLLMWRSAFTTRQEAKENSLASILLEWLRRQPGRSATDAAVLRIGPRKLRSRSARDAAVTLLEHRGEIFRNRDRWEVA
ncbi:DUF3987 domain-containing protein [Methylolobus aquaticus]